MKSQLQNQGELAELKVSIEKEVADAFAKMSANTGVPVDDLVVIALKRFRSAHCDYEKAVPHTEWTGGLSNS